MLAYASQCQWMLLLVIATELTSFFVPSEAVLAGSGVQGMYKLLPGFLRPGARVHRQQAGLPGRMLLSRW